MKTGNTKKASNPPAPPAEKKEEEDWEREVYIFYPNQRKAHHLIVQKVETIDGYDAIRHEGSVYRLRREGAFLAEDGGFLRKRKKWVWYYRAGNPDPILPTAPKNITAEDLYMVDREDVVEKGVTAPFRASKIGAKLGAWKWLIVAAALLPVAIAGVFILLRTLGVAV